MTNQALHGTATSDSCRGVHSMPMQSALQNQQFPVPKLLSLFPPPPLFSEGFGKQDAYPEPLNPSIKRAPKRLASVDLVHDGGARV